jgi:DNA topoisomerase I
MSQAAKQTQAHRRTARAAGLRYVSDDGPGIRRVRSGKGYRYLNGQGRPLRKDSVLRRIRSLAIPPAWTDVWICPDPHGHLQATGRDAKGRKQHIYHPGWREVRNEAKYGSLVAFGRALPRIRAQVARDLRRQGLSREKVLAVIIRLLDTALIRIGNEDYARQNGSFGLTTMRDRHAVFQGGKVRFEFKGKSGIRHAIAIPDRRLARIVRQCQELPGQELFQYLDDDGRRCDVGSTDVNAYLREVSGADFTAKTFRTWAGTVLAAQLLHDCGPCETATQAKQQLGETIATVAKRLGNTKAICRKCYIHPAVMDAFTDGSLRLGKAGSANGSVRKLSSEEVAVLRFLRSRLAER